MVADLVRRRVDLVAENALLRQQLIVAERKLAGRVRWTCGLPKLDRDTGRDVGAERRWSAMPFVLALLAPSALHSEPARISLSRTSRCDSNSLCSAADRSDPDSGASIAPSGCCRLP